jgi:molecular chaperone DnaK (HSP70)
VSPKRRVHLGIDYGTSASKIVFRDYGAPGGEVAVVVLRDGSFRIPSRVCATTTKLLFGDDRKTQDECDIYESLKMQVASEASGNPEYYFGPHKALPNGFSAADLAALTVWFLISEGHRAVAAHLKGRMDGVTIGMTMGVPMAFFKDQQLRSAFLTIAR